MHERATPAPGEITALSATAQAAQIRAGQLDSQQLLQAQAARVAAWNPRVRAVLTQEGLPAPAADGHHPPSPLAGVSFGVKDNIDVVGTRSFSALAAWPAPESARHASVVARLIDAGLVCNARLNMHAMALGATNQNADFGDAHNPVRLGHVPGGSSGGSAAAVAAGFCSLALGTDTMGSVRIPAAYCGLVGFKPSYDALELDGVFPLYRPLDHVGLIARSVEDVRLAFGIAARPRLQGPGDGALPARLRVARPIDLGALGLTPPVRQALEAALAALEARAPWIDWVPLDLEAQSFSLARRAGLLLTEAALLPHLAPLLAQAPERLPEDLRAMMRYIDGRSAADIGRAGETVSRMGSHLTDWMAPVDALLLPTTPHTSFPVGDPAPASQADFSAPANMNGAPAISLPIPVAADALPVGMQVVGHRGADLALLALAGRIEALLASP